LHIKVIGGADDVAVEIGGGQHESLVGVRFGLDGCAVPAVCAPKAGGSASRVIVPLGLSSQHQITRQSVRAREPLAPSPMASRNSRSR
jgi:hypothetical protein